MEKTKVLYISQEITPYLPESKMSIIGRQLPQGIQEKGKEIRTFMPRYGCINERRNQLHEVIRLSGMNLIINDTDHPLIIKVASIQAARMQVYFIDNEDFFQRKHILHDAKKKYFEDNDERAIFFARGVLETIKKLRWSPDVIHCHGWITSLIPLYVKRAYKDDPMFSDAKIVYSVYNDGFSNVFDPNFSEKLRLEGIRDKDVDVVKNIPDFVNLSKMAINLSDAVIVGSEAINSDISSYLNTIEKPVLGFQAENYIDAYSDFYDKILSETYAEF
ncbi:MAG TPA: glycogen synthase [Bacteroidales bacterium]|nr:MAG: glycogen synthase [Bacteroidetes bacterium GWF2_33_38]OFY72953.1 MAG: glycogen synthase [Bacteroidetes bacterium RIFOXYA12_FULL_33_9]OFY92312.1 MAG: glycogen synthase [Bacteroidetes bacterium RIFOXYA2_FULL_33_7]HBF87173.1 glycogen synthase [Bacteroidales bacterium]